jgi:cob(I)alamin adenosyltransferase
MTVYYTRNGDKGSSGVIGGTTLDKDHLIFEILGDMDELNSWIAVSLHYINNKRTKKSLETIQDNLFSISAILASSYAKSKNSRIPNLPDPKILEDEIAYMGKALPPLTKFVIPGGGKGASYLHVARTISRRAERKLVALNRKQILDNGLLRYANRLSSFLFVAALYENHLKKIKEKNPKYI